MGVRQLLNGKLGPGIGAALILVAIALLAFEQLGNRVNADAVAPTSAFYTDDNGKTFFKDAAGKIVPFDHNGKQAFRADVFKGADGKEFVGLIYRFTEGGRREMELYLSKKVHDTDNTMRTGIERRGMQVKPVGSGAGGAGERPWMIADETTVERLQAAVKSPSGAAARLVAP
jgi:hypothetical protein